MDDGKNSSSGSLSSLDIKAAAYKLGVDAVGIARAGSVRIPDRFMDWLNRGFAGEMSYLARNIDKRLDPTKLMHQAQSIVVVGLNYFPALEDAAKRQSPYKVARYAWGEDYHNVLRQILRRLRNHLREIKPNLQSRICVDTAPFMDKYWAEKAALGWQGKHTNLVSRSFGSWLVLGSLIIDASVDEYERPHANYCGRCRKCIDACPTGALREEYLLDATRCISYWTIESKHEQIPRNLSDKMKNWVFGCDICLAACPFNRFQKPSGRKEFSRREEMALLETGEVINLKPDDFERAFAHSPIRRPGFSGIKRNILAASIL